MGSSRALRHPADPAIERDLAAIGARTAAFAEAWCDRLATVGAAELRQAPTEYEQIQELGQRPGFYAALLTASDTPDSVALALEQRAVELQADLRTQLLFFELELLTAGGSAAPGELAARPGFDLTSPAFWNRGCAVITAMVDDLERS